MPLSICSCRRLPVQGVITYNSRRFQGRCHTVTGPEPFTARPSSLCCDVLWPYNANRYLRPEVGCLFT
jgi:hypothetical protein